MACSDLFNIEVRQVSTSAGVKLDSPQSRTLSSSEIEIQFCHVSFKLEQITGMVLTLADTHLVPLLNHLLVKALKSSKFIATKFIINALRRRKKQSMGTGPWI